VGIPLDEIVLAHERAKKALLRRVSQQSGERLDPKAFTIGFARRATGYKRATLFFHDLDRLAGIAEAVGPFQIVLAGKAHPRDLEGKQMIRRVFRAARQLRGRVAVTYLENYEMSLAALLCGGTDLWLNTPVPPLEASGTSGMKAALNGVPSLSTLDGWWVEGCVPGVTGWAIGADVGLPPKGLPVDRRALQTPAENEADDARDAEALAVALEQEILPCFYADGDRYATIMRNSIALNASFFNTQRMALEYLYAFYGEGFAPDASPRARSR
jgi:starch phosphorylase